MTSGVHISQLEPTDKSPVSAVSMRRLLSCILEAGNPRSRRQPGWLLLRLLSGEQTAVFLCPLHTLISSSCEVTRPAGSGPPAQPRVTLVIFLKAVSPESCVEVLGVNGTKFSSAQIFPTSSRVSPRSKRCHRCRG